MSAYIVDNEHIRVLVWAGLQFKAYGPLRWLVPNPEQSSSVGVITSFGITTRDLTRKSAETVGQMLYDQNARSVNHRYDDDDLAIYDHGAPACTSWSPVDILKAISGYEYQSCETPDWPESEAFWFCYMLRKQVMGHLPGYDDGPWSITTETAPAATATR